LFEIFLYKPIAITIKALSFLIILCGIYIILSRETQNFRGNDCQCVKLFAKHFKVGFINISSFIGYYYEIMKKSIDLYITRAIQIDMAKILCAFITLTSC